MNALVFRCLQHCFILHCAAAHAQVQGAACAQRITSPSTAVWGAAPAAELGKVRHLFQCSKASCVLCLCFFTGQICSTNTRLLARSRSVASAAGVSHSAPPVPRQDDQPQLLQLLAGLQFEASRGYSDAQVRGALPKEFACL